MNCGCGRFRSLCAAWERVRLRVRTRSSAQTVFSCRFAPAHQSCSISCRSGNIALIWVGLQKHSNPTPQNILKQKKWFSSDPTYWDHDWTGEDVLLFWWRAVHQTCLQLPKLNWMVRILWFSYFIFIFCCCEAFCNLSMSWWQKWAPPDPQRYYNYYYYHVIKVNL